MPYDTVYIGLPIWWYVSPAVIITFLGVYDFNGKKIVLFATSGERGPGKTLGELKLSVPAAAFVEVKLLNGKGSGVYTSGSMRGFCDECQKMRNFRLDSIAEQPKIPNEIAGSN